MTPKAAQTQRTDAEIFVDARHALDVRPRVPKGVRVHVDHGIVTLTGSVRWADEKSEAADAVCNIPGVDRIVNDIVVADLASAEGFERPEEGR